MATRVQITAASAIICLAFSCPRIASALDPAKAITQYHQDTWTERDGLPQGSVQTIIQTTEGYLWIGTRDGLARFDGVAFTVFRTETHAGLPANDIRCLFEDRSGQLWIGTFNAGLSRYSNGKFTSYTTSDGLPSNGIRDIFEDRHRNLWIGTGGGLVRRKDEEFELYGASRGLVGRVGHSVREDRQGRLWVATETALHQLEGDRFESLPQNDELPDNLLRDIYVDHQDVIWITTLGSGLWRVEDGKISRFRSRELPDNTVRTVLQDSSENLWIGTWSGLCRLQDGRLSTYTKQDGLPNDYVEVLYEDREGSLWIGTRGGGLARLRDGKFSNYTTREGLANNFAKCVLEDRRGVLWIGSHGGGLSRFENGVFTNFTTRDGLRSQFVWSIGEDCDGNIWVGTARPTSLSVYKGGRFTSFGRRQGLPVEQGIRAICTDPEGNIWVGGDGGGLGRFREGRFMSYTTREGLPGNAILALQRDLEGNLWIGTTAGLCRFRDGQFKTFTAGNGLAHNTVYAIYQDSETVLWFGTQGGLTRYAGGQFQSYTTRDGLFQNVIYQVLEDREHLWMSSNRGVFSISKSSFADFDQERVRPLPSMPYGIADGMKATQCEGGSQPAGWKTRDGKLWFPTAHGVAMINPGKIKRNEQPPPVLIEQVVVGNRSVALSGPAEFPPNTRELRFHYTALSFLAPEKVRFRYKLENLDKNWVNAESRRIAFYNEIPAGRYRFHVVACNDDGVWNETGASFAFSLLPHFYQTAWFYALCAAIIALAAWSFHRHRMRRAEAQFSLVLAERGRIARDLHDTLAQGFAGIAFQLEALAGHLKEAPAQAQGHLKMALNMVRHSLAEARRSVMNLRSTALESGDLASALSETARQMMVDQEVNLDIQTSGSPKPLPPKIENDLLRVGQEAITNALKHGHADKICIELDYQPQSVTLRVRDNGLGFDPAQSVARGSHFGLLGMRERAKQMGASLIVQSSPGQGTEIVLEVSIK
jgi:ligand-binding sensor domain-containing protein/signal transduction histidine kinase